MNSKPNIQSFWLNSKGNPLGIYIIYQFEIILEFNSMTEWIALYVKSIFPEKHMTPIVFRRVVTSLIFQKKLHEEGKTVVDFLDDYSHLINTSHKVLFCNII